MKGSQNLRVLQQQKQEKEDEGWVRPKNCCVCQKLIAGPYGRDFEDNWTCSLEHERSYRAALLSRKAAEPQPLRP